MKALKLILVLSIVLTNSTLFAQDAPAKEGSSSDTPKTSRYYYFPNLQAYFDTSELVYYYKENNEWHTAPELPVNYGGYSLYNKVKVLITDYDGENPQQMLALHKKKYPYNSKGRFSNTTADTN